MTNPLKSDASTSLGLFLARAPMGAFFLLAGYQKVFKIGVDNFVKSAIASARPLPFHVSPDLMNMYLHAVPFLELTVGTWLLVGILTRVGAFVAGLMLYSFILGSTGWWMAGGLFSQNVIFLGLVLGVLLAGPGCVSLDHVLFNKKKPKPHA